MNRKGFLGALTAALAVPGTLLRGNVPPAPPDGTRENLGVLGLDGVDVALDGNGRPDHVSAPPPAPPDPHWNCRCVLRGHVADLTDGTYKTYVTTEERRVRRGDLLEINGEGHLVRALPPYEVERVLVALTDQDASGHVVVDWSL